MFFPVITKNWNWNFLIKNLVNLKDKMELKIKNFNIFWVHWKIQFLGEGGGVLQKTNIEGGDYLKRGAWQEREGDVY